MSDAPSTPNPPRPRRRGVGLIVLLTFVGVAMGGYWAWLKASQMASELAGPVVIVGVAGSAIGALVIALRNMSVGDMLDAAMEAALVVFEAVAAVLRGIWHWFLGLLGLD